MNRAIIFAGGKGQRMNNDIPKQFMLVNSKPIIVHTVEKFQNCKRIDSIIIVCTKEYIDYMQEIVKKYSLTKVEAVVIGGESCQQSIYFGLCELTRRYGIDCDDFVLLHDGVRPLIDEETIEKNIICAEENGNCVTVSKAAETIVLSDNGTIKDVLNRNECYIGRAPQTFRIKDIYNNHLKAVKDGIQFVDSAALMKHYGEILFVIEGKNDNIKITNPTDYNFFRTILENK